MARYPPGHLTARAWQADELVGLFSQTGRISMPLTWALSLTLTN
jgi:hypothetical protein